MPRNEDELGDLADRLRSDGGRTAAEIHARFVHRLIVLACRQFEPWLRSRADHEDVVQSAFKSFFARSERGEFELRDWEEVWRLLALITVRKCRGRAVALRAGRRDAAREIALSDSEWLAHRDPTPEEAAVLAETLRSWLDGMPPVERRIAELGLMGLSAPQIAREVGRTERTIRRKQQAARERLDALLAS